jgi:GTP-binding protein
VPEVAFAGRSNAGKSSAINTLAGRRRLAFASKTPGRTQLINFFSIASGAYLVDLPGYGYAGVPLPVRAHWESLVGEYVGKRESLAGVVVVMDARHPLTPLDRQLLDWLTPAGRRVHVLLTKADKLSKQAAQSTHGPAASSKATIRAPARSSFPVPRGKALPKPPRCSRAGSAPSARRARNARKQKPRLKGSKAGAKNALIGLRRPLREEKRGRGDPSSIESPPAC